MNGLLKFLFPKAGNDTKTQVAICGMRVYFGAMLLTHGYHKLTHFSSLSQSFPDILGLGSHVSLGLAVFAEFFCSLGFIGGFLTRLTAVPMAFTMAMAAFVALEGKPFASRELALLYLGAFVMLFISGGGRFSIDNAIRSLISKKDDRPLRGYHPNY